MKSTTSLCEQCYKHIPAVVFEYDNKIYINKDCDEHGVSEHVIENSARFFHRLHKIKNAYDAGGYVIEVTDRCNLTCPHCYQEPDNKKIDKTIVSIVEQISSFPVDGHTVTLAGAEPTMRNDLSELIIAIRQLGRSVNILTNGLKLSNKDYVQSLIDAGCEFVTIGLNHPNYQGQAVHDKQLVGINNCVEMGLTIKNINYTIEGLEQIPFILDEIQNFSTTAKQYRIRGGAEIGRYPNAPKLFLSDIVEFVKEYSDKHEWQWTKDLSDDNLYHYTVHINGLEHRLIQWADAGTIDLDELQCGPWGSFISNTPVTNLMHQVILRDAVVNKGVSLLDTVPERYCRK